MAYITAQEVLRRYPQLSPQQAQMVASRVNASRGGASSQGMGTNDLLLAGLGTGAGIGAVKKAGLGELGTKWGKDLRSWLGFGKEATKAAPAASAAPVASAAIPAAAASTATGAIPLQSMSLFDGSAGVLMSDGTLVPASQVLEAPKILSATSIPESAGLFGEGSLLGGGEMTAANYVPSILGAVGAYDLFKNKRTGGRGALQGAASGAGIGFTLGGPPGAAIGAGIGGLASLLNKKKKTDAEQKRLKKLIKGGTIPEAWIPASFLVDRKDTGFRSNLAPDFVGKDSEGLFVNNKFAQSRNEADLTPEDIWGYATFMEQFGPKWWTAGEQARRSVADYALKNAGVREHKGTMDVTFTPEQLTEAQKILDRRGR